MGLGKRIQQLFRKGALDSSSLEELEEILIESDISARTAIEIVDDIRGRKGIDNEDDLKSLVKEIIAAQLIGIEIIPRENKLNTYLILGVNGVGKTTTIAKLAKYYRDSCGIPSPVLSAADTFRAGAIDQLRIHGERLGLRVVHQNPGADPGAVIFDTIESCQAKNDTLILADTAGRMHNRENLVRELQKIQKIIMNKNISGDYKKILVIDANTGQNGFQQAETFNKAVGVDAVIITKLDSTAKGGIAVNICRELQIPLAFTAFGESYDDIKPFDPHDFAARLLE